MKKLLFFGVLILTLNVLAMEDFNMRRIIPLAKNNGEWYVLFGLNTDTNNRVWSDFSALYKDSKTLLVLRDQTNGQYNFTKLPRYAVTRTESNDLATFLVVPFKSETTLNNWGKNEIKDGFAWVPASSIQTTDVISYAGEEKNISNDTLTILRSYLQKVIDKISGSFEPTPVTTPATHAPVETFKPASVIARPTPQKPKAIATPHAPIKPTPAIASIQNTLELTLTDLKYALNHLSFALDQKK